MQCDAVTCGAGGRGWKWEKGSTEADTLRIRPAVGCKGVAWARPGLQ